MDVSRRELIVTGAALTLLAKSGAAVAMLEQAAGGAPAAGAAWDLTDLYPNDAAWASERTAIQAEIARLPQLRGTLGRDAGALRTALQAISDTYRKTARLYIYASLKADEDLRVAPNQERKQQAQDVFTAMGEATAWVEPEILAVGQQKVDSYVAAEPGLAKFRFYLANILRRAPHTLSRGIRAGARLVGQRARRARTTFATSSPRPTFRGPTVTLSTGKEVRLDDQGYTINRDAAQPRRPQAGLRPILGELQAVRKLARRGACRQGQGRHVPGQGAPLPTAASQCGARRRQHPRGRLSHAGRRGQSRPAGAAPLFRAAAADAGPARHALLRHLSAAGAQRPPLHPRRDAQHRRWRRCSRSGPNMAAHARARSTAARWMDPFPRQGKASGAYMNGGAYDVHPYLLLNLTEDYEG